MASLKTKGFYHLAVNRNGSFKLGDFNPFAHGMGLGNITGTQNDQLQRVLQVKSVCTKGHHRRPVNTGGPASGLDKLGVGWDVKAGRCRKRGSGGIAGVIERQDPDEEGG